LTNSTSKVINCIKSTTYVNPRNINITTARLVSIGVARHYDHTVDKKRINSGILKTPFLEGVQRPKKSPLLPGNNFSDALLMSDFHPRRRGGDSGAGGGGNLLPNRRALHLQKTFHKLNIAATATDAWTRQTRTQDRFGIGLAFLSLSILCSLPLPLPSHPLHAIAQLSRHK